MTASTSYFFCKVLRFAFQWHAAIWQFMTLWDMPNSSFFMTKTKSAMTFLFGLFLFIPSAQFVFVSPSSVFPMFPDLLALSFFLSLPLLILLLSFLSFFPSFPTSFLPLADLKSSGSYGRGPERCPRLAASSARFSPSFLRRHAAKEE